MGIYSGINYKLWFSVSGPAEAVKPKEKASASFQQRHYPKHFLFPIGNNIPDLIQKSRTIRHF